MADNNADARTSKSVLTFFRADLTPEEAVAGFDARRVEHPDRSPARASAVIYNWADPFHRLVNTSGRDGGVDFQLHAFGQRSAEVGAVAWFAEQYWQCRYGPT